jgi:hypothetical protein
MGVFKEASFFGNDAFFEQLFKHEGVCVWNDSDLYSFMSTARQNYWPTGCISTGIQIKNSYSSDYGNYLYLDLKPTWNGNMTYGLYTDSICKTEYDLPDKNIDTITRTMGLLYGSGLKKWNDGLEAFKVCQPCKAYNLKNTYASSNYYGSYSDSSDPNQGYFQCYDDAGYTNVNQCMKFRTHAQLEVCTWEDLVTATNQGGILQVKVGDTIFGSERMTSEEYQYLMKSQQESNLKASKAEAQTMAMYRMEAEKVAALKPSADRWSDLGGTSLAIGAVVLISAVFWIGKRHIDRAVPHKTLAEPLLPPSRDFLGKELSESRVNGETNQTPAIQASIPFGNESDDEPSINKGDNQDDQTSVSSLSYTSNIPEPAAQETPTVEADALARWYANVQKIDDDSHKDTKTEPEIFVQEEQDADVIAEHIIQSKKSDETSVFDGVETSNEEVNILRSTTIDDSSKNEYVEQHDTCDSVVQDASEGAIDNPNPDLCDESTAVHVDAGNIMPLNGVSKPVPESTIIDNAPVEERIVDDQESILVDNKDQKITTDAQDVPVFVDDSDVLVGVDGQDDGLLAVETESDVVKLDHIENPKPTIIPEDVGMLSPEGEVAGLHSFDIEPKNTITNLAEVDDSQYLGAVADEEQTALISNVSLIETNNVETTNQDTPDELIQYLSMSASEHSCTGESEAPVEGSMEYFPIESTQAQPVNVEEENSSDDKTVEEQSIDSP